MKAADEAVVKNAKREITVLLAKHVSTQIMIPASLRAFVIGTKGKNLKAITEQTGVKVNIAPRDPAAEAADADANNRNNINYDNDEQVPVTLEGDEINVKQAQAMIQAIVAERTSKITQSNPPCPLPMSLSATSPQFWNTSRDSDPTTSLFQSP